MALAAFYARVSTTRQDHSLAAQLDHATRYAQFKNLSLHAPDGQHLIFQDSETSRKPLHDRDGGRLLLNTLKAWAAAGQPIPHLIITKLDRLDRSTELFLANFKLFNDLGVTLHIVDCGGDSITSSGIYGKMLLTILAAVAEAERELIRERADTVRASLRSKSYQLGSTPYGFDAIPDPHNATTKSGRPAHTLVLNPGEIQNIKLMRQLRDQGLSYHQIAQRLNALQIPSKTGKLNAWQSGNVASVLNSRSTRELFQQ